MKLYTLIFIILISIVSVEGQSSVANQSDYAPLPVLVIPKIYTDTSAAQGFIGPLVTADRTFQLLINENQLTGIIGQYIDRIAFRLPPSATGAWPDSALTFLDYDIYFSGSVAPVNRSLTFSQNIVGIQKQVRSGQLFIPAGSYTSGSSPNNFGPDIILDSSYLYTGGHLLVELRKSGYIGMFTGQPVEAAGTSSTGYGTDFSACWQGTYTATTGTEGNFTIIRLTSTISGIQVSTGQTNDFTLNQNYPNPFNPGTTINFQLNLPSDVKLIVYDALGREVSKLIDNNMNAGSYEINFNGEGLTSGVYYYSLSTGNITTTKKMLLVK